MCLDTLAVATWDTFTGPPSKRRSLGGANQNFVKTLVQEPFVSFEFFHFDFFKHFRYLGVERMRKRSYPVCLIVILRGSLQVSICDPLGLLTNSSGHLVRIFKTPAAFDKMVVCGILGIRTGRTSAQGRRVGPHKHRADGSMMNMCSCVDLKVIHCDPR